VAQRGAFVSPLTTLEAVSIVDVPREERAGLDSILEESFEGWYLMHSRGTLRKIELVRAAVLSGKPVGLAMLKILQEGTGYVFYIAVAKAFRKRGIAKKLLDDALAIFKGARVKEVFASVEEENVPSEALFASEGFSKTSFGAVSKKYGHIHTLNMYREMVVVPGEILLRKVIV
jgi:ribosomal protein S18 acetylase RimI-like enzyme